MGQKSKSKSHSILIRLCQVVAPYVDRGFNGGHEEINIGQKRKFKRIPFAANQLDSKNGCIKKLERPPCC